MQKRNTAKQVNFRRPFYLSAMPGPQPAGTYTVRVEHEQLGTSTPTGWRRSEIVLELPCDGGIMDIVLSAQELREALVHDGDQGTDPPANPDIRKRQPRERFRPY